MGCQDTKPGSMYDPTIHKGEPLIHRGIDVFADSRHQGLGKLYQRVELPFNAGKTSH